MWTPSLRQADLSAVAEMPSDAAACVHTERVSLLCIYMYIYIYIYIYIYLHVHIHIYVYLSIYIYMYI